ncbi:MAG: SagB/ThcOx family dehydrogenase [Candidatus Omnitrophota bacterium]|nr:MAG: SagB/ThcOx family dehydrogenase [Candidatus Omnitrophota bacterium]
MKRKACRLILLVSVMIGVGLFLSGKFSPHTTWYAFGREGTIKLPSPRLESTVSVERAIFQRKSIRAYGDGPLTLQEVSQLLWAGGGVTIDGISGPTRAYPSAGGLYPLEIYLVAGKVKGLAPGIYQYHWKEHSVVLVSQKDVRGELSRAAFGQKMIQHAPVSLVFTAVYRRSARYGERGKIRYVPMDMGGAGQNIHLQAEALGLGTVIVGAFDDDGVKKILGIGHEEPLYIMPVGRK